MPKKKRKTNQASSAESSPAEESFKCFICKKDCETQGNLDSHISNTHGPRFNCQCAHCTGKRRHDSAKLVEEHILKDGKDDIKTFKCIVCEYQVFLLCKCLSHIQTSHHTVALQKQFECMKCNIGFEQCMELHNHIQTHTSAQRIARCGFSHCKKCFTTAALLQNHLRHNHKITKPYELLSTIKGSLVNPKAPNIQPTQPHAPKQQVSAPKQSSSGNSSAGSTSGDAATTVSASTSAWLMPDPPSPPPADSEPTPNESNKQKKSAPKNSKKSDKEDNSFDPDLACPHCSKPHKSQTSLNNHLHVFHKEKLVTGTKKRKRRANNDDDDDSDVSSDWTSEDSDWEPSNTRSQRSSPRNTRSSTKKVASSGSDNGAKGSKKRGTKTSPESSANSKAPAPAPDPPAANSKAPAPDPDPPAEASSDPNSHKDHGQNGKPHDCLACQQQEKKQPASAAEPLPIKIKQEPMDPTDMSMPVISNVFSMTNAASGNVPNGYSMPYQTPATVAGAGYSTVNAASSGQFNQQFESGDERPPSAGSSLHNGSNYSNASTAITPNRGPLAGSPTSNPSPSTGWQPSAMTPADQASLRDECAECLERKPSTNKCMHCGIIFLEPTMHMIHMGWHGEKTPFQCHTCGLECNDKYSFTTHIFKAPHL